jgi:hypothetical protein
MFMVFAYYGYYPDGGMHDFQGAYKTHNEALDKCKICIFTNNFDCTQVFCVNDIVDNKPIYQTYCKKDFE